MVNSSSMRLSLPRLMLAGGLLGVVFEPLLAAEPATITARFNHGRVIVPTRLNEAGPYSFLLDTACTIPTIHPEIVDELSLAPRGYVRIHGIAGVERAPTYPNVAFNLDGATYRPRRVAAIPSERNESRRRRDGVIGSSFFERFVVEINGPRETLKLHSPTNYVYDGPGEVVPFRFREEIPVVKGILVTPGHEPIEAEFEIDTGCDSGLCLGDHFVNEHNLLATSGGRADRKFGVGGGTATRNGSVPMLRLGKLEIKKPQTDFFLEGSPVEEPLAGHIGMGVFQQYKVIIDYARQRLIIESP
jgi:hypothetical protein